MGVRAEPWQTAEIAGPKKALLILKPEVVVALLKKAKRPLLVVGHLAIDNDSEYSGMIDYAIRISKTSEIPVVATAHTIKEFLKRSFQPAAWMSVIDLGNRLNDPSWSGLDGLGPYDLVLIMGLPYYMEFTILAALKHFSTNLKTVTLYRFYNPHASWSFPNLSVKDWNASIQVMLNKLERT